MSAPAALATDDAIVLVLPRSDVSLTDLATYAEQYLALSRQQHAVREVLDDLRHLFRNAVSQTGRKSHRIETAIGTIEIKVRPRQVFWCRCCAGDVEQCARVRAGDSVAFDRHDLPNTVSVRLVEATP